MLGLMYKDLVVLKKDFIYLLLECIGSSVFLFLPWESILNKYEVQTELVNTYTMTYVITPAITYFLVFQMIAMVQGNLFAHDERKVWNSYCSTTPFGRNGQVLSKYLMVLGLSFVGFVWGTVCDMLSMTVSGIYGSASGIYTVFFFGQILFRAIEMPFIIRYGQKHGRSYKVLIFMVILFFCIVYGLFGPLPKVMSIDALIHFGLKLSVNQATLSTTVLGIIACCPYIILLLYYGSYKISCRLYRKGVEAYDV